MGSCTILPASGKCAMLIIPRQFVRLTAYTYTYSVHKTSPSTPCPGLIPQLRARSSPSGRAVHASCPRTLTDRCDQINPRAAGYGLATTSGTNSKLIDGTVADAMALAKLPGHPHPIAWAKTSTKQR